MEITYLAKMVKPIVIVENEFKVGDKQFEKDTLKKQVSNTITLENLTDKPNRIVQMWRRSRWNFL